MNNRHRYLILASLATIVYWLFDSSIHWLILGEAEFEWWPSEANEVWMRSAIAVLLLGFGLFADWNTRKLLAKEEEKRQIYLTSVAMSYHMVNDLLNNMQLFMLRAKEQNLLDTQDQVLFEQIIEENKAQLNALATLDEISVQAIRDAILSKQVP